MFDEPDEKLKEKKGLAALADALGIATTKQFNDEYDFDAKAEEVAKSKGLVVVFPKSNQIQLDLDTENSYDEFLRRLPCFMFDNIEYSVAPSASGLPHRHVTLTFLTRAFTEWERICIQAALGDDPLRVFLNTRRLLAGCENPSRLFEKPTEKEITDLF